MCVCRGQCDQTDHVRLHLKTEEEDLNQEFFFLPFAGRWSLLIFTYSLQQKAACELVCDIIDGTAVGHTWTG